MAFWDKPLNVLPKQSHKWFISFNDKEYYYVKSTDRPSFSIENVQAKYMYSHIVNYPKRVVWEPVTVEFYDILLRKAEKIARTSTDNSKEQNYKLTHNTVSSDIYKKLKGAGYSYDPTQLESYIFKENLISQFGKIKIIEIDEFGKTIETWELHNPFPTAVGLSKLDYSTDDVGIISVKFVYNYAENKLETGNTQASIALSEEQFQRIGLEQFSAQIEYAIK